MENSNINVAGLTLKLVSNNNTFDDYDVAFNEFGIRRVCVSHTIRIGETFNIYFGKNGKCGVEWCGSLEQSLQSCDLLKCVTQEEKC
jgi:hypothetical protein